MYNNGDNIEKVAIYTRVSTEDQAREGFSLDSQLERLRAYCFSRQWTIFKEYIDDGYSGRNTKRPRYQDMLQDIDQWDAIVVIKMDRIHRNSMNFMKMMANLQENEKNFVSMTESFDSSNAMGRFFMDMSQRIAQLESEQTGERTFLGMYQKAKTVKSGWMGHGIPFGYEGKTEVTDERYASGKKKTKTVLIPISEEIELIKEGFKLAGEGYSITDIAREQDLKWSKVHYYLHNPFYAGLYKWTNQLKKTSVEPIISRKLFNKVQEKINERSVKPGVRKKPLLLPLEDVETWEIPKDDLKEISSIRYKRFKHPVGA